MSTKCMCMRDELSGLVLLFISAFLYSGMGCFVKLASETGLPSTELVFLRACFQGVIVVASMFFFQENDETKDNEKGHGLMEERVQDVNNCDNNDDQNLRLIQVPLGRSRQNIQIVVARGATGGLGFILYYFTISSIPLGDAITLLSLTPVITIFLARFVLGEPLRLLQILATILSIIGAACIAGGPSNFFKGTTTDIKDPYYNSLGYVTALIGSVFRAVILILTRKAGTLGAHTLQLSFSWTLWGFTFSSIIGIINAYSTSWSIFQEQPWKIPSSSTAWWYILGLCILGTTGHFMLNYSARLSRAGLSSIIRSSDIMWGYLFEILVFQEIPSYTTWMGVFFIVCSLLFVAWEKLRDICNDNKLEHNDVNDQKEMMVGLKSQNYGSLSIPSNP